MATEAQKRAVLKYDAANTIQLHLKLNKKTDADILEFLGRQENIQGYIKELIREDIKFTKAKHRYKEAQDVIINAVSLSKRLSEEKDKLQDD